MEGNIPYPDGLKGIIDGTREWPSRVEPESPSSVDDLWHAAINGHGKYVNVRNSSGFLTEMAGILANISSLNIINLLLFSLIILVFGVIIYKKYEDMVSKEILGGFR